jgi:hypothetical protein
MRNDLSLVEHELDQVDAELEARGTGQQCFTVRADDDRKS